MCYYVLLYLPILYFIIFSHFILVIVFSKCISVVENERSRLVRISQLIGLWGTSCVDRMLVLFFQIFDSSVLNCSFRGKTFKCQLIQRESRDLIPAWQITSRKLHNFIHVVHLEQFSETSPHYGKNSHSHYSESVKQPPYGALQFLLVNSDMSIQMRINLTHDLDVCQKH